MSQMNKAIASLPNLSAELVYLDTELMPSFMEFKTKVLNERAAKASATAAAGATAQVSTAVTVT